MNVTDIFRRISDTINRAVDNATRGSVLNNWPVKAALHILIFLGLPLLLLVSLPWGVGIILLVVIIAVLVFGIPFNW